MSKKIMKEIKVKLTFSEDLLGTASSDPDIHREFIASKAPNKMSKKEEIATIGEEAVFEKSITVFPKDEKGKPFLWDYQVKGFFKGACAMLRKVSGTKSSKCHAYKKEIDGLIFITERQIPILYDGEITICQRPLRAQSKQGERIALTSSESIPAGATVEFTIQCLVDSDIEMVIEWLDYGALCGIGQWRNSGKGRFSYEVVS